MGSRTARKQRKKLELAAMRKARRQSKRSDPMRFGWVRYCDYLKSKHWKRTRRKKLAEKCVCQRCGRSTTLQVHHLTYARVGMESMDDLRVLCRECHAHTHGMQVGSVPPEVTRLEKRKQRERAREILRMERADSITQEFWLIMETCNTRS